MGIELSSIVLNDEIKMIAFCFGKSQYFIDIKNTLFDGTIFR